MTLAPGPLSASLNLYALSECLYAGAPFMTLPSFDLAGVYRAINESAVTRLVVVPTMLRMIAERGAGLGAGAPTGAGITSIISAGAKLGPQTLAAARRWAPNATIFEYYGASELGFLAATRLEPDRPDSQVATAVGRAFPGVRLMVRDGQGAELAAGCPAPSTRAATWSATATSGATTGLPSAATGTGARWGTRASKTWTACCIS